MDDFTKRETKTPHGIIESRYYDPAIVTNKFEVGEIIEWVEFVTDSDDGVVAMYAAALIKKMTPYTIVIERIDGGRDGQERRMYKYELLNGIDSALKEAIEASIKVPSKPVDTTPYQVYTLSDPRTDTVYYVGISKNMKQRYIQHVSCQGINFQKNIWIQKLLTEGLQPTLTIRETAIGRTEAQARERYWIQHYQSLNAPLTNIAENEDK